MNIVKERIPPFAIGLAIGTVLSFFLLSSWWNAKKKGAAGFSASTVHHLLASAESWLNTDRALTEDDLRGRVIVVHFWSRACLECQDSSRAISSVVEEFGDRVTSIGVFSPALEAEKEREVVVSLLHRRGLREATAMDKDFRLWREFSIRDWPTTLIIDPIGHIFARYPGRLEPKKMRADLERLFLAFPQPRVEPPLPVRFIVGREAELASPLRFPTKIAEGKGLIWITDSGNHRVLALNPISGLVEHTIGDGIPGMRDGAISSARFRDPQGILVAGDRVWVADTGNHLLREINLQEKTVARAAGTGERRGEGSPLDSPTDLSFAPGEAALYISVAGAHQILAFDRKTGELTRGWGNGKFGIEDGPDPIARFMQPAGMTSLATDFFVVDSTANSLRKIDRDGVVKTLIGGELLAYGFSDGGRERATMQRPEALVAAADGLIVADSLNHALRFYDLEKKTLTTLVGGLGPGLSDGNFPVVRLFEPTGIVSFADQFLLADSGNHAIRIVDRRARKVTSLSPTFAPSKNPALSDFSRFPPFVGKAISLAAREPFTSCLVVPAGWKLGEVAPSWLALAREKVESVAPALDNLQILSLIGQKKLALGEVSFPPLEEGATYHMLASIFICRGEGEENECAYQNQRIALEAESGLSKPGKCAVAVRL